MAAVEHGGQPKRPRARTAYMREYRSDPKHLKKERLREQAAREAQDEIVKRHFDEYVTIVNEQRKKLGLTPYHPRGTKRTVKRKTKEVRPADVDFKKQEQCPHNQGLKKLSWGTVCVLCNQRIR